MHELSIAQNIVDSVYDHIGPGKLSLVTRITMEIGAASGVAAESLQFAFDSIVSGTPLASAGMEMILVPFRLHCNECNGDSENGTGYMVCPKCDSLDVTILSGTEMILKQIELNEE